MYLLSLCCCGNNLLFNTVYFHLYFLAAAVNTICMLQPLCSTLVVHCGKQSFVNSLQHDSKCHRLRLLQAQLICIQKCGILLRFVRSGVEPLCGVYAQLQEALVTFVKYLTVALFRNLFLEYKRYIFCINLVIFYKSGFFSLLFAFLVCFQWVSIPFNDKIPDNKLD